MAQFLQTQAGRARPSTCPGPPGDTPATEATRRTRTTGPRCPDLGQLFASATDAPALASPTQCPHAAARAVVRAQRGRAPAGSTRRAGSPGEASVGDTA